MAAPEPCRRARLASSSTSPPGCHLCEAALSRSCEVCAACDVSGSRRSTSTAIAELEAAYRERLPVVEVDGDAAFTYFVDRLDALLRAALAS